MAATSVRFSEETTNKLEQLATKTGRSKSFYIRRAVEEAIDQMMWEYNILLELENIRTGKTKTISLEELKASLDD